MLAENTIGSQIIGLSNILRRATHEPSCENSDHPTGMQHWILGHIHRSIGNDIFQKDLEAAFKIRRSTATGMLQLLEKNGYIKREQVDYDARLKKLTLTPKALSFCEETRERIRQTERLLVKDFSESEKNELIRLLNKVKSNLETN